MCNYLYCWQGTTPLCMRTYVLGLIMVNIVALLMWQHDYSFCWLIKAMNVLNERTDFITLIKK